MGGIIAGSVILKNTNTTNKLKTITLTINNNCNLKCPHCYLQYEKLNYIVKDTTINSIFESDFEHLAIVGKEPLLNKESISLVENLIERCHSRKRSIGIITNGLGLPKLKTDLIKYLDYIDVSFDGGPKTYELFRKASFQKVISGINEVKKKVNIDFVALHTLCSSNVDYINDMMEIKYYSNFKLIIFSPYLETINNGVNDVTVISLEHMLNKLSESNIFMDSNESLLLLDKYHLLQAGLNNIMVKELITKYNLESKITIFEKDPLNFGIIRVTYDDFVLTPYEAIDPKGYSNSNFTASNNNLNDIFNKMQSNVSFL